MTRFSGWALLFSGILVNSMGCEHLATVNRSRIDGAGGRGGAGGEPAISSSTGDADGTGGATTGSSSESSSSASSASTSGTGGSGGATSSSSGGAGGGACVPVDDSNPCTSDVCEGGLPVHTPTPAGSACSMGGTLCDGQGSCAECLAPADCAGPDDACKARTCVAGKCGHAFTAAGTALPVQIAGDCKHGVCDGNGVAILQDDGEDLPDDSNACTDDVCTAGVASHSPQAQGTTCGGALVCDAAGTCVGCNTAADCAGTDDECKVRTCVGGACGVAFTAVGTLVAAQTAGDCLKATCDGSGQIASVADSADLPPDDGNACTDEACNAGAPSHPARANGLACTDGDACTVADTCQAGTCASGPPVICAAVDQCHAAGTCNPVDGTCSNPNRANGSSCNDGVACTQADVCTAGACNGAAYSCTPTSCQASSTCDGNGGCTLVNKPVGTSCPDDGNLCTSDACDAGGTCGHITLSDGTRAPNGLNHH
jgi:hypothetical protein